MYNKFRLGLTMAGAVSAGAYTGGVLDYLIQMLDLWEEAKKTDRNDVPKHEISIDVISGASAGGITGAMAALVLHLKERYPVTPDKRDDEEYLKKNVFYNAWVNLVQDDMLPHLLDDFDIETEEKVVSLLNSTFIEDIANRTITQVPQCTEVPPPYVNRNMELILTLSNLDGFTYKLYFPSEGASKHIMKQHRDYAFFRLGDDYDGKGRIPLNLQRDDCGLNELLQAAPATGAFPIGLAYRKFVRKKKYIIDNKDLIFFDEEITKIKDLTGDNPEEDYVTYNVDGGMLNNEPFDLTMKIMARKSSDAEVRDDEALITDENKFDSTIIMIDPFPSDDSIVEEEESPIKSIAGSSKSYPKFPYSLITVIGRIFGSMRGELLFKGEEIVKAFSGTDFSRFMIAPKRRDQGKTYKGSVAIACGALGGFSGFFSKEFRRHDFFLGRYNCQSFLRKYFRVKLQNGVPVNSLFANGYTKEAIEKFKFQDPLERAALKERADEATWYVPIIPDMNIGNPKNWDKDHIEEPLPYPKYDINHLRKHKGAIMKRFKTVVKSLNQHKVISIVISIAFLGWGGKIYEALEKVIEKQFRNWRLM